MVAWLEALDALVRTAPAGARPLVFFDEPALVLWRRGDAPIDREDATDLLSGALAACRAETGVHVCGHGDLRLALEAGHRARPLGVDALVADVGSPRALPRRRRLDRVGCDPDRPAGRRAADPLWRLLVTLWCELTRRGCDPLRLRSQALVTPACGLAGHGPSQAERALLLAA